MDDTSVNQLEISMEDFLEHFGVKGMKWGVRQAERARSHKQGPIEKRVNRKLRQVGAAHRAKVAVKADAKWEKQNLNFSTAMKLYNTAAEKADEDLPGINNKYKNKNVLDDTPDRARYHKEITDNFNKHYQEAGRQLGKSPSGKKEIDANINVLTMDFVLQSVDVQHAALIQPEKMQIMVEFDELGFVTNVFGVTDLEQTSISMEDFLEHFGVPGMKWGVRNKSAPAPKYQKSADHLRARDLKRKPISSLSNADIKFLNERLNLEQSANRLNPNKVKKGRDTAKEIVTTVGVITSVVGLMKSPLGKAAVELGKKVIMGDRFNDMISIP